MSNYSDLPSSEKIKQVIIQKMPIENNTIIITNKKTKTYEVKVTPQAIGKFEQDEAKSINILCVASSMPDVFTILSAILFKQTYFTCIDSKNAECGNWYNGDKYFISIINYSKYIESQLDGKILIDGDTILQNLIQKKKLERKNKIKNIIKPINKKIIIRYVDKKISFFDKLFFKSSQLPLELAITTPFTENEEIINYSSNSKINTYYETCLYNVTCSCEDFKKKKRRLYDKNDIRRYCEHLIDSLIKNNTSNKLSDILLCMLSHNIKNQIKDFSFSSGLKYYISYDKNNKTWIDVFTRKRKQGEKDGFYTGNYEIYGYNIFEKRWSYGDGPAGATEIKKIINSLFPLPNR